ncbi:MAG TPA: SRPBCC family protein [Kofleriaceae bacterium]|nr:SRPBCC family protein [Kofleriaceae bacterium]
MSKLQVTTDIAEEIRFVRQFDAPRRLVLRAMSEPALVKRWQGGTRAEVAVCEIDFRVGGAWKTVYRLPDGNEFFFSGVYKEISDERVVNTELFNGEPPGAEVITTLVEQNGKTTLTCIMRFESEDVRDMVLATGMGEGAGESYDELETLLASLM